MDTRKLEHTGKKKVDTHLKAVGFTTLTPEWPSCYFHPELRVYCVVYVDDFKIYGPNENVQKAWSLIRQEGGLVIEKPKEIDENGIVFLGCKTYRKPSHYRMERPQWPSCTISKSTFNHAYSATLVYAKHSKRLLEN